jgi:hypothetical protein
MDETRHGGDEVTKEDETVMDDAQGSSMSSTGRRGQRARLTAMLQCSHTSYRNCDLAPT